jgi:hypothetical protein
LRNKDPFLRTAIRLQNYLGRFSGASHRQLESVAEDLLDRVRRLHRQIELARLARGRLWTAATARMEESARQELSHLYRAMQQAITQGAAFTPTFQRIVQPTLRESYEDLLQLQEEFEDVRLELVQRSISVTTEPIELEGVFLGRFEIRLALDHLSNAADASAFEIIALDPHPASANQSVTHPHVQDQKLCAGDAAVPISTSLWAGRLCDAFLAINSVLHTYNSHSPYVALSNWSGTECSDCGAIVDEDETYFCAGCDQDYCSDCIRSCGCCDESRCRNCLDEDRESEVLCCRGCQEECGECRRMVDAQSFDQETGLCPGCLERRQKQAAANEPEPETQIQEIDHEHEHLGDQRDDGNQMGTGVGESEASIARVAAP